MRQSFVMTHLQSQQPCFFLQLGLDFVDLPRRAMSAPKSISIEDAFRASPLRGRAPGAGGVAAQITGAG
jgi:hypothetical protein